MHPGDRIGDYTIVSRIGEGGLSIVYLAKHVLDGTRVVVKELRERYQFNPHLVDRFVRDATILQRLRHPHLARVFDVLQRDGRHYVIEEYLSGGSLADLLQEKNAYSEREAIQWCRDALRAVNYLHENGIVHRDLKPSNLVLDDQRQVRVIDFGIARALGETRMTRTGDASIGSAEYMSPEQILTPQQVDHLTDVYSMGVVLYELLSGSLPFEGPTSFSVLEKITRQPPPPLKRLGTGVVPLHPDRGIAPKLAKVVLQALEKRPERRFGGCAEFARQLERYLAPPQPYLRRPSMFDAMSTVRTAVRQRAKAIADALTRRSRQVAYTPEPTLGAPAGGPPDPVLLGVSAPRQAKPGMTFTTRFAAYIQEREDTVVNQLRSLDANAAESVQTVVGLPPSRGGRWLIGAPVTVRVSGAHLQVNPESQSFEWNGTANLVSFLVSVPEGAPNVTTQVCFEAFIEAIPVAFIPLNLVIGRSASVEDPITATARPMSNAFACYASKDAPVVALLLSALKRWDPHADVFMDCLDLTPNQDWRKELERLIPSKDWFLLFWSINASRSPWVEWELQHARSSKGIDWIRPMPIEDPETAPPPDFLQHLQFRDKYLVVRESFLRRKER